MDAPLQLPAFFHAIRLRSVGSTSDEAKRLFGFIEGGYRLERN